MAPILVSRAEKKWHLLAYV